MALDLLSNIAFSVASFLWLGFISSIPVFALVLIAWLANKIIAKPRKKYSWLARCFALSYIIILCIVAFAYFAPLISAGSQAAAIGSEPGDVAPNFLSETLPEWAFYIIRAFVIAFALALLIMPLALIGEFANEAIEKKFRLHKALCAYAATLLATFVAVAVIMLFPGIPAGIIYLVYFA